MSCPVHVRRLPHLRSCRMPACPSRCRHSHAIPSMYHSSMWLLPSLLARAPYMPTPGVAQTVLLLACLALPCPWVACSTSCTVTFACTCCAQPAVCVRLARRCARISRSKGRASEQARSPPLSSCAQSAAHGMSSPRSLILRLVRAQKAAQDQLGSLDGMDDNNPLQGSATTVLPDS